jgi:lipid II:glycine glycyltransferase (peptidoglycan interpeptide bridge formation enzyme)
MYVEEIKDKDLWEQYIASCSYDTSFFQSWNWGEFQQTMNNGVLRLGFFDKNDNLFGVAQAIVIRAKRGNYLYFRNGPVSDWNNNIQVEFIINSLKHYAQKLDMWFIRISPLISKNTQAQQIYSKYSFPTSPMSDVDALDTWILDITQSEDEILKNMRKTTRYEINKAKKIGVEIIATDDIQMIDEFYPIYEDTIVRQQWTGYSKKYIRNQFEIFAKDNQAKIYLAKYNNVFIAGSIFVYHGDSSYYHYSGSLTEYRKIPAPALIQWHNILEAKNRGLKKYNFWGIAPEGNPNHPWQGLTFFKQGFGGEAKRWIETKDIPIKRMYWLTWIFEQLQKKYKGY